MSAWQHARAWAPAAVLWAAGFVSGLLGGGGPLADDLSRGLYWAAGIVTVVILADRRLGWRVRSLECQVRKLQAQAEGENLVIEFARREQPRVKHPASNGNGHRGPA